jgi:glycosyltransferase involved in cell wall biosynthesis
VESRVSVVIPAYNHERYVGAAIESLLSQTYTQWELIVIDDGSTDGTPDVLRRYSDPRIQIYRQVNQDAYNAINAGLAKTTGQYVAILNSDDVYHPDRLARLVAVQRESGAACLFTDVQPIDADGGPILDGEHPWVAWHAANRQVYFESGDIYTAFLNGNFMIGTSNLFLTAETVRQVGPFAPLRYLHDYDYIFRVMLSAPGRVRYLHDQKLMSYRIHGANTLSKGAIVAREQDRQVIRTYLLAGLPEASRARVAIGADRLMKLERELAQVRAELARPIFMRRLDRYRAWVQRYWARIRS